MTGGYLDLESETPSERRARILADNDADLLLRLVELRRQKGVTQQVLAQRLGVTQATVASFERYDSDPKLSTIRRYAHALEALVNHVVEDDDGQLDSSDEWHVISVHLPKPGRPRGGMSTYVTPGPRRADFAPVA